LEIEAEEKFRRTIHLAGYGLIKVVPFKISDHLDVIDFLFVCLFVVRFMSLKLYFSCFTTPGSVAARTRDFATHPFSQEIPPSFFLDGAPSRALKFQYNFAQI